MRRIDAGVSDCAAPGVGALARAAIRSRKLTMRQCFAILGCQAERGGAFADHALELGFLSSEECVELSEAGRDHNSTAHLPRQDAGGPSVMSFHPFRSPAGVYASVPPCKI